MFNKIINFIKKKYKIIIPVLVLLAIVAIVLIRRQDQSQPELTFENPQYRDITKTLEVSGHVDAKRRARLRFLAGGKIAYLGAQEGEWVKKWQTIASIDQRDLQKRLEKQLNLYMKERWDWEDTQDDIEHRTLDTSERRSVDKEQWDLENSVIDVELQDIAVSQSVMSAPFDGILVTQPINTTNTQVLSTDYFEIVDPNSLIFRAEINEEDIALVNLNQSARITLDAYLDETLNTNISYISYIAAQSSGGNVFYVEFPLIANQTENETTIAQEYGQQLLSKYRLGLNGDVNIELDSRKNVLTVPIIAITSRDGKTYVDVKINDQETQEKEVQTGLETEEYVEVTSGLSADDLVLIPSTL